MESVSLLDCAGRRRSPATLREYHKGRTPRNKGLRYPADPPTVEEIIAVMRATGEDPDGLRLRGLIVVLWRAGLRISEALALTESDLDPARGSVLVRRGKGGKRREVGMDRWAWESLEPWLAIRTRLPVGALFCVLRGPLAGGHAPRLGSAASCEALPRRPVCAGGWLPTSSGMPTPSRCPGRESLCSSSSASSATQTSGSPPPICGGSTTPRSSKPSTNGPHR